MADDRIRRAARRAASDEGGDTLEQLVVERLRAGSVSRLGLEVAAYAGSEAARAALGRKRGTPSKGIVWFLRDVPDEGARYAAVLALARRLLPLCEAACADPRPRQTCDGVALWVACPCPDHLDAVRTAGGQAWEAERACPPDARVVEREKAVMAALARKREAKRAVAERATHERETELAAADAALVELGEEMKGRSMVHGARAIMWLVASLADRVMGTGRASSWPSLLHGVDRALGANGVAITEARAIAARACILHALGERAS